MCPLLLANLLRLSTMDPDTTIRDHPAAFAFKCTENNRSFDQLRQPPLQFALFSCAFNSQITRKIRLLQKSMAKSIFFDFKVYGFLLIACNRTWLHFLMMNEGLGSVGANGSAWIDRFEKNSRNFEFLQSNQEFGTIFSFSINFLHFVSLRRKLREKGIIRFVWIVRTASFFD